MNITEFISATSNMKRVLCTLSLDEIESIFNAMYTSNPNLVLGYELSDKIGCTIDCDIITTPNTCTTAQQALDNFKNVLSTKNIVNTPMYYIYNPMVVGASVELIAPINDDTR